MDTLALALAKLGEQRPQGVCMAVNVSDDVVLVAILIHNYYPRLPGAAPISFFRNARVKAFAMA